MSNFTKSDASAEAVHRLSILACIGVALAVALAVSACACPVTWIASVPAGGSPGSVSGDGAIVPPAAGDADGDGGLYATITIGDQRFEFDLELGNNGCSQPAEGVVAGGGFTEDADPSAPLSAPRSTGAHLTFAFSPEGSLFGGSSVVVEDFSSDIEWWADEADRPSEVEPDQGLVRAWADQANIITGTASFIDPAAVRLATLEGQPVESRDGTFEISCGERP